MDIVALQNQIIANPEYIFSLLEDMGFEHIKDHGRYITFQNLGGDNPAGVSILKDTLQYQNFSHGSHGNLFTLIMETHQCGFAEALNYTAKAIGFKGNQTIILPFGGFYKNIIRNTTSDLEEMKTYDEGLLPSDLYLSNKFLQDGVSLQVQQLLGIRYSHEENAILIPIYNMHHDLIGCKARNNDPECDMAHRWYAFLPYKKSNVVYGLDVNYSTIISHDKCVIFEAEKSVGQGLSFDLHLGLAIAGHNISKTQSKYIKSLNCSEIIVAFDQDLQEEEVEYEAKKLKINRDLFNNKVCYLYDRKGEYLPKGSKMSPTDAGKKVFIDLMKHCKYEV